MQKQLLLLFIMLVSCHFYAATQVVISSNHARFLREGDKSFITATLTNKSNKHITGQVHLTLINPINHNPVDGWFQNVFPSQYYSVEAGAELRIQFPIQAAFGYIQMLRYQLEATILENKKDVVATSKYTDSFQVYTNRILVSDSMLIKTNKTTTIKGIFAPLLQSTESSTHKSLRISFTANTPLDYWKLQMGDKQFTTAYRARFDTLLVSDFISNEMGTYSLQTIHSVTSSKQQTKISWTRYNKIEKPVNYNAGFKLQKTIQQKINGFWNTLLENATLRVGDTLNVTVTISTPKPFEKILLEENTMGGATRLLPQSLKATNYAAYFTKEFVHNSLMQQQIHYQYLITNAGVYTTGNTDISIKTKAKKHNASNNPIKLFIPAIQLRIEE